MRTPRLPQVSALVYCVVLAACTVAIVLSVPTWSLGAFPSLSYPAAQLSVSPKRLDFGDVGIGAAKSLQFVVSNPLQYGQVPGYCSNEDTLKGTVATPAGPFAVVGGGPRSRDRRGALGTQCFRIPIAPEQERRGIAERGDTGGPAIVLGRQDREPSGLGKLQAARDSR